MATIPEIIPNIHSTSTFAMRNVLLLSFLLVCSLHLSYSLTLEGLLLLEAKHGLVDTSNILADWKDQDPTPCNWTGVSCTGATVTSLDLANLNVLGPFPPSLCHLPNLAFLSLYFNYINSSLNSSTLRLCQSLMHLDLSRNCLVGPLPDALAELPSLVHLDLAGNSFSGSIPPSFGKFPKIERLCLVGNFLTGTVPAFLGDLSTLRHLNLSYNLFVPGPIPVSLSKLSSLEVLWLAGCNLNGQIPASLGNLTKLTDLDLSTNHLTGMIPSTLNGLTSVAQVELYDNSLTGSIPSGLSKLTSLRLMDLSMNELEGPLPDDIFHIPMLERLQIYSNRLTGPIPSAVAKSTSLIDLQLFSNQLNGTLPADFGKNAPLMWLDLSINFLTGEIPESICDHGMLKELFLFDNMFTGQLPEGLAKCGELARVSLKNNQLTGEVPAGLWGLPQLYLLELTNNSLSGRISPVISSAAKLSKLAISDNEFEGPILSEIGTLSKLYEISASNNWLSGPLPVTLGNLAELDQLNLDNNSLSGELLRGVQSWVKLSKLNLANNDFTGEIPPELGALPVLNYLNLSGNLLMGQIPNELQNLKLTLLNLSNNKLTGPLPHLFASEPYRDSFLGNPGLCGDLAGLCQDSDAGSRGRPGYIWIIRLIFIFVSIVFIVGVAWFYMRYKRFSNAKRGFDESKWTLTAFHKLDFSEHEILDCIDEDNVIGSGASGKVYKGVLRNGEVIAVKKLSGAVKKYGEGLNQASIIDNAFEAEVATLGKIRHKNIVKLLCCCIHKECKLLVYEYMPNGSLGKLLHSSQGGILDWQTRYKIALNSAEGLSYLHHDCVPPIVHRDVKSNNVLLDADFVARVADFGVAKVVETIGNGSNSMSIIVGSCGYIAPEYAYTLRVNEKSDTYSFGVVLLELVTGKPPVDPEFGEKDLVMWVSATIEQKGIDHVIDPKLDLRFKEEMTEVLNIGFLCTSSLPVNRPSMRQVVKMLQVARAQCRARSEKKYGQLSPYFLEECSDNDSVV